MYVTVHVPVEPYQSCNVLLVYGVVCDDDEGGSSTPSEFVKVAFNFSRLAFQASQLQLLSIATASKWAFAASMVY